MELCFSTFTCPNGDFKQVLHAAQRHRYRGIEFRCDAGHWHGVEVWTSEHERARIKNLMAKAELDETRRAEQYREMCQIARDDGGTIIPIFVNFVYARNKKVQHSGNLAAAWELDGGRGYHRWWFAS